MSDDPAFSDDEYRRRWRAVTDALAPRGLDAIAVTSRLHVEYLSGTDGSQFWVAPLILTADRPPTYLVRAFELDRVRADGRVEDVRTSFDRDDAVPRWAETLRDLGLADARLGLELDNQDLTHRDVTELGRLLPRLRIEDASSVLPRITAVKSAEELAVMRTASDRTDAAIDAFAAVVQPGASEAEIREAMRAAAIAAGSDDLRGSVAVGRHSAVPHAGAGAARLGLDDVAVTEVSGYHLGYTAARCRTAVVGDVPEAVTLYDLARRAVDAAIAALRPGAVAGDVDRAARTVVEDAGRGDAFRHRTGYANGLRANGRLNLSLSPGATDPIEVGMTFHTPVILFEADRFSVACSETILVTEDGGAPFGAGDRELLSR